MTDQTYPLTGAGPVGRKRALRGMGLAALLGICCTGGWLWMSGLAGVGVQLFNLRQSAEPEDALWLPAYSVAVQAVPVTGLRDNLSGLTFNRETGTLFGIVNRPAELVELSRSGELLRRISLKGIEDPEGIAHIEGPRFALAEEARQRIVVFDLAPQVTELDLSDPTFPKWPAA